MKIFQQNLKINIMNKGGRTLADITLQCIFISNFDRIALIEKWRGLRDSALEELAGITGIKFVCIIIFVLIISRL